MDYYGMCSRAGKIVCGADALEEEIKKGKIKLVIIAEDASERTKENFISLCNKKNISNYILGTIDENSKRIGKVNKAVIGIRDKNFAIGLCKIICENEGGVNNIG